MINNTLIVDVTDNDMETWVKKKPEKGAHIRVNRGLYYHHGIYIGNGQVIHFTGRDEDSVLDWSKPEVIETDLNYFLKDGVLEVKEYNEEELKDLYPADHIIAYAKACLGDKGYNLVFNNCEHFANTCTLGRFRSKQVERVFGMLFKTDRRTHDMGILGTIGGFFKGLFKGESSGSRSVSNTTYEPDKVKVAEIESQTKIRLADMETERIKLSRDVQLEIMEQEYRFKVGYEEAKALGFNNIAATIVNMQEKLTEIAQKRIAIIENGSLDIVREFESFYIELKERIDNDNLKYSEEKLPKLLEVLEKYDENSPTYKLYYKRIEDDMNSQIMSYNKQIEGISERQAKIVDSFLVSKEKIIEQSSKITNNLIENFLIKNNEELQLGAVSDIKSIENNINNKKLLCDGENK